MSDGEALRGEHRSSALWGSGNGGGDSQTSPLWGKGGRGLVTVFVAVLVVGAPLAAAAREDGSKQRQVVVPPAERPARAAPDAAG
jgi:hypothetical protein